MSKKKRTGRRFVGVMKQTNQPRQYSPEWIAMHAKQAMDYLAPLIRAEHIAPNEALVLVAMMMDHNITGKERYLTEEEITQIYQMIITCWQQGLLTPSELYPHTLEDVLSAQDTDGNEAES